jgi:hypothetical protein
MKRQRIIRFGTGTLISAGLLWPAHHPVWAGGSPGSGVSLAGVRMESWSVPSVADRSPTPVTVGDVSSSAGFRSSVALIFDGGVKITARLSVAHDLGRALSPAQVSELYAFLEALPGPREKNRAGLNLLKNDLVSLLQDQTHPPAGLTGALIAIYRNPAQDPVARDYALQHLVTWYEQGAADAPEAQSKIQSVLRQATQETTSLAGTALLGLHRLITSDSGTLPLAAGDAVPGADVQWDGGPSRFSAEKALKSEEISHTALRMLGSADLPSASRITAIQVCAEREVAEALPVIQALAQTGDGTALRISAIAALGYLGGPEQVVLLQRLDAEPNPALRPALEGALRRLQTRLLKNPALTQNSL